MKLTGIKVVEAYCPQNHPCPSVRVCPAGAIEQQGFNAPVINEEKCTLCGRCLKTCPVFQPVSN